MVKLNTYSYIVDGMKREDEELIIKALLTVPGVDTAVVDSGESKIKIIAKKGPKRRYELYIKAAIEALELRNIHIRTKL
ncbi:MAG: hypothetical protein JXQ30_11135 [Spirochaetes bacterium]|nr:hypothetical protein [Spirochaetota bacterium]